MSEERPRVQEGGSPAPENREPEREISRHLFPLPELAVESIDGVSGLSRGVAQRIARRRARVEEANSMVRALNWLSGCPPSSSPSKASSVQVHVLNHVLKRAGECKPTGEGPSPQEAFKELLRSTAAYGGECAAAPYREGCVALPGVSSGAYLSVQPWMTHRLDFWMGFTRACCGAAWITRRFWKSRGG